MATVFLVILDSTSLASRPKVSCSDSAKTGLPPASITAFAVAMKVNDGTMPSLPLISCARSKVVNAEVPELNVKAYFLPINFAILCSNSSISGPMAQYVPRCITLATASMSDSSEHILNRGIFISHPSHVILYQLIFLLSVQEHPQLRHRQAHPYSQR